MIGQPGARLPRVRRRWRLGSGYRVAVFLLWPIMTAFTKRDWRGMERLNTDDGGIIVVANHISWFDPLVIAHALWENDRPPRFLAKESVFRVPIVGSIVHSAGQIRVYRETKEAVEAVRDAVTAVREGECVVVYPEGTITKDPQMWPMAGKTGAARIALATGRPVFPMGQWGATDVMRPYRKELRLLPRKTMHVWVGEPVDLSEFANQPMTHDTLEQATERIMDALTAEIAGIRGLKAPATRFVPERGHDEHADQHEEDR